MNETMTRHRLVDTNGRFHGNEDRKNSELLMTNFFMHYHTGHIACKILIQLRATVFSRIRDDARFEF